MNKETRRLVFCGDIHGEFKELIYRTRQLDFKNTDLVLLGDIGVGFEKQKYYKSLYDKLLPKLEEFDINIYSIRGNHDDPGYFDGHHNFDRLMFCKDYEMLELCGKKIYPIGGGISLDRDWRIDKNAESKSYGSSKKYYWEEEAVFRLPSIYDHPGTCDIVVSHEAPISFDPVSIRPNEVSLEIWKDAIDSRNYLQEILKRMQVKNWFHGHYHKSTSGNLSGTMYRGLDIMEFFEYRD